MLLFNLNGVQALGGLCMSQKSILIKPNSRLALEVNKNILLAFSAKEKQASQILLKKIKKLGSSLLIIDRYSNRFQSNLKASKKVISFNRPLYSLKKMEF